ncbi:hypothetical protein GCM10023329_25320 [Streptomyces sanyensis]|uniref:Uncharacterized protein n=1 Tax=Streptomyces sanyensis TaxID=568869 RepID=A0ABP9A7W1_9ACTN
MAARIAASASALRGRPVRPPVRALSAPRARHGPGGVLLDMPETIPASSQSAVSQFTGEISHGARVIQIRYDP